MTYNILFVDANVYCWISAGLCFHQSYNACHVTESNHCKRILLFIKMISENAIYYDNVNGLSKQLVELNQRPVKSPIH